MALPADMEDSAPVNVIASGTASRRVGPFLLTMGVSMGRFGEEELRGARLRFVQTSALLAAWWPAATGLLLVARYLHTQSIITALRPFLLPSHEFMAGVKVALAPTPVLEVAIEENVILPDNSPDLGIHVGLVAGF